MQATIESLEELGISLDHNIKCQFTRGFLPGVPCWEMAVARITFRCKCGAGGKSFICAWCLDHLQNQPDDCRCSACGKILKPHRWSHNRIKWKEI